MPTVKQVDLRNATLFVVTRAESITAGNYYAEADWPDTDALWQAVTFGDGNFTMTFNDAPDYQLDRGRLDDVQFGDETPLDITFEGKFDNLIVPGGTPGTDYSLTELIVGRGMANDVAVHGVTLPGLPEPWLVLNEAHTEYVGCVPYTCWLELHFNPKMGCPDLDAYGTAQLFRYFRQESVAIDIDAGQMSVSGKCHILDPIVESIGDWEYSKTDLTRLAPVGLAAAGGSTAQVTWINDGRLS